MYSIPTESGSGPFVTSNGELDLSKVDATDGGLYTCTGRDAAGNSKSQTFNIIVEEEGMQTRTQISRLALTKTSLTKLRAT